MICLIAHTMHTSPNLAARTLRPGKLLCRDVTAPGHAINFLVQNQLALGKVQIEGAEKMRQDPSSIS